MVPLHLPVYILYNIFSLNISSIYTTQVIIYKAFLLYIASLYLYPGYVVVNYLNYANSPGRETVPYFRVRTECLCIKRLGKCPLSESDENHRVIIKHFE